jgi:hypothetical protein
LKKAIGFIENIKLCGYFCMKKIEFLDSDAVFLIEMIEKSSSERTHKAKSDIPRGTYSALHQLSFF